MVSLLKNRNDLTVIYEKDYVTNKKDSGYRSYHLICEYPVQLIDQVKIVLVEVQISNAGHEFLGIYRAFT